MDVKNFVEKASEYSKVVHLKIYKKFLKVIGFTKNTSRNLFRLFQFALYMVLVVFIVNIFSIGHSSFGEWGDFFGGVLNPILTFLTFMGLLITIIIQQKELRESRDEFKGQKEALEKQQEEMTIQSFDNKFFQMLNSFNKTTDSLNANVNGTNYQGKEVFKQLHDNLKEKIRFSYDEDLSTGNTDKNKIIYFLKIFKDFNNMFDTTFKYYFINLYQLIKFIDEDIPYKGEKKLKYAKKYTNLIRAQLSKSELILLAYNAIGIIEFSGQNYKKLIEEYSFFEHMRYDDFNDNEYILSIVNSILLQYKEKAFGTNSAIIKEIENISKDVKDPEYQKPLSIEDIHDLMSSLTH